MDVCFNLLRTHQPEKLCFGEPGAAVVFNFSNPPVYSALTIIVIDTELQTDRLSAGPNPKSNLKPKAGLKRRKS